MRISSFQTNREAEISGVWKNIGEDAELLVARDQNPKYINELRKELDPYSTKIQRANMTNEKSEDILCRVMSKTILLGWKNIQGEDGRDIEYSQENAYKLLRDMPEFKHLVIKISEDIDNFREIKIKEVEDELGK